MWNRCNLLTNNDLAPGFAEGNDFIFLKLKKYVLTLADFSGNLATLCINNCFSNC